MAAVSGGYDAIVGVTMLAGRPLLAQLFNVALPAPPIHADLNGIFLLSIAAGYLIPYRDPGSRGGRAYLWMMGPLLTTPGSQVAGLGSRVICQGSWRGPRKPAC